MKADHAVQDAINHAAALIRSAQRGMALTGAGISTPSGIPDFRSPNSGLWNIVDPFEVASMLSFRRAPERFYEWIRPLATLILEAAPNPAHLALTSLQKSGFLTTIITQNIDGLHQKAGSSNVYEIHGSVNQLTCVSCYLKVETSEIIDQFLIEGQPPRCSKCGSILKLDVILIDEQLPMNIWHEAEQASQACDLMLVVGSSLEILPVSRLPLYALERGAPLIVVNLTETYIDIRADVVIPGDAAEILPRIAQAVERA
ncbi:MAG: NAD-dependent deacylase [Anaerolineales bacterium]|nr:NAD-dependent deacylase [Anaerolineales bacterium]